jgi:DNA-directed RNA polymerase specialized sigma24 family protein
MAHLSEGEAAALLTAGFDQQSMSACAKAMNLPIGTVASRLRRARATATSWLAEDDSCDRTLHPER